MSYKFFQNRACEFFPCHEVKEVDLGIDFGGSLENFNCLFCFCPLYNLKDECGNYTCGGEFKLIQSNSAGEKIIKDCTNCILVHIKENYDKVITKLKQT
ncbi:MAG: cysteine-rich small domain-containing protein [Firmicutes bacterium]|nr:cysteine-rich small domain-containing protein [Bacillota bacterium]